MANHVKISCGDCGKTSFVTVGHKRYCAECGTIAPGTVVAKPMLDLRQNSSTKHAAAGAKGVVDLRAAQVTPLSAKLAPKKAVRRGAVSIPQPAVPAPKPASAITKFPARKHSTPQPKAVVEPVKPSAPELPAHVQHQVREMGKKAIAADRAAKASRNSQSGLLRSAISAAREPQRLKPATVAAVTAAFVVMGGFIWTQNSPKWSFRNAALQAGIEASLPTYLPSTYTPADKPQVKPGEVTLSYTGPGAPKPLTITQKRTSMDAASLRDTVVSRLSDNFAAIPGQGLTVYLYQGGDVATWVNHGVWYTVSGAGSLGRDQILKIAYGL